MTEGDSSARALPRRSLLPLALGRRQDGNGAGKGRVVGFGGMWLAFDEAHITTLGVDPDHRGQGFGELLFLALVDEAIARGANWLTLEVRVSNVSAQTLYRKYGFTVQGTRKRYYSDNQEDALIMWSRALSDPEFRDDIESRRDELETRLAATLAPSDVSPLGNKLPQVEPAVNAGSRHPSHGARPMIVLGIETSCDETSAAIVADGHRVLSSVVSSQIELHRAHGGVVPELAARRHVTAIVPVVERAFSEAGLEREDVDAIAVTQGPGLAGALVVGMNAAKAMAYALDRPAGRGQPPRGTYLRQLAQRVPGCTTSPSFRSSVSWFPAVTPS